MSPGCVAYIPRGYFHETLTSDEPSVGISFVLDVMSYHELLGNAVLALMRRDAGLRQSANGLWHERATGDQRAQLVDQQEGPFTADEAYPKFEATYGQLSLDHMFEALVETGYLTIVC